MMNKKGKLLIMAALAVACILIALSYEPKEKLKVNLHEVKYIERDYKTGE